MNNFPSGIKAYRPVAFCGRGAYGAVYLAVDAVGTRCALKIVEKNVIGGSWEREFRGLKQYKTQVAEHPNLIRIFHIEDCGDFFYYTMEPADNLSEGEDYCPATLENLIKRRGRIPPDALREMFESLLDALEHLHRANMIHRDIKPDNIIFIRGVPKLGDIGLLDTMTHTLSLAGTQEFVPPEYLLGQVRTPTSELDLYALGKTLYCAFSGNPADRFPVVPGEVLKDPETRAFNQLVRAACTPERGLRLKSIAAFRRALHGEIGWGYELGRFIGTVVVRPVFLAFIVLKLVFSRKWVIFLLLTLFAVWLGMVMKTYWQLERELYPYETGFHAAALRRAFTQWHVQLGRYDLYDFQPKTEFSVRHYGERHLVTREEYLRRKNSGIPSFGLGLGIEAGDPKEPGAVRKKIGVSVFQPKIDQNTLLNHEYIREKVFDEMTGDRLEVPSGTEWRDRLMLLPATRGGVMKYLPELPLIAEVEIAFKPYRVNGDLEFVLTAAEYVPYPKRESPDVQWKRQMRFPLALTGDKIVFEDALYRDQDCTEDELSVLARPKFEAVSLHDRFYRLRIITADYRCRVYLDDRLVWGGCLAFYGGYFGMRYRADKVLEIKDFSVYDTGFVQPGEKRRSRLKLPLPPPEPTPAPVPAPDPDPEPEPVAAPAPAPTPAPEPKPAPVPPTPPEPTPAVSSAPEAPPAPTPAPPPPPRADIRKEEPKAPFTPQKHPAEELSRSDYQDVQSQIAECIAKLDVLKEILPDYKHIAADEVVIDRFYEHEKGGNVYEFHIPPRKIRAEIRIQYVGFMVLRGFTDFRVGDRKIEF
jgi:hypothetical protein